MRYRTIPFARPRTQARTRRTVSPVIPAGAMMNGLEPMMGTGARTFGYRGPASGMGRYGGEYPNSSFLNGAVPAGMPGLVNTGGSLKPPTVIDPAPSDPNARPVKGIQTPAIAPENTATVIMRGDDTKAPGFPGFYQWLSDWNPSLFDRAVSATPPHLISATKVLRTGGATLQGIYAGPMFADRAGLGDTTAYSSYSGTGSGGTVVSAGNVTPPLISTDIDTGTLQTVPIANTGETSAAPTPTSSGAAQLVSALVSAGSAVLTDVNQQTLFNTNLARAAAGLPPLTGTGAAITGVATSSTTMLLIGGAALLLVFLMSKSKG